MALDKQKILNDLGNVMNQLKCADCGCMGKLFNQGQGHGHGYGTSQGYGGGCRQGYGHPCCGEPYTMGEGMPAHNRPCMSYCNAPKLYADGYNFMNQNVMQPVIKEVYDDLRSLNSGNTVTNNPLGAKMGLTPGAPTLPGVCDGNPNSQMGRMNPGGQSMTQGHPMMQNMQAHQMAGGQEFSGGQMSGGQQMPGGHQGVQQMGAGQTGHGGQQMSGTAGLSNFGKMFPGVMQGEGGGLSFNPMEIAMQMNPALAKQQPGMEAKQNPMSGGGMAQASNPNVMPGMNAPNVTSNQMTPNYQAQPNHQYANNPAAHQSNNQVYAANTGNQLPSNFPPQGMNNSPMRRMNANQGGQGGGYGQHEPAMSKFKEMFPGVMQGLGGEVNFDPMEIAIQMNPANKQAAAMSSMEKLMTAKPLERNSAVMKPVMNGMNAVNANFAPSEGAPSTQVQPQHGGAANQMQSNQQQYATTQQIPSNQQPHQIQQPQIYTSLVGNQDNQQVQPQDPNTQNYQELPPQPIDLGYPNQIPGGRVYEKEPILPVDNSRYNTIGQPIELLPAKTHHMHQSYLPQTLSPQRVPSKLRTQMDSNVKSTVSKTSLLARQHGRTPSRAQLQQVYNQYKGSQSHTNNQIREPTKGQTVSDGRLNAAPPTHQMRQSPVERLGGDTAANNQAHNEPMKGGHTVGQVGDVTAKPGSGNADLDPAKSANARNGLQDMKFTSYPKTTAWSFHGRSDQPRFIRA